MICSILIASNAKHAATASALARELSTMGHGVTFSADYDEILNVLELPVDATILIGGLEDRDGFRLPISTAVKRLAAKSNAGHVIALTDGGSTFGRAAILEAGARKCIEISNATADDLSALVSAWERRRRGWAGTVIEVGDLLLDTVSHTATRAGHAVALSARGYAILERAVAARGEPLDRQSLRRIIGLPIFQTGGAKAMIADIKDLQIAIGHGLLFDAAGLRYVPETAAVSETKKATTRVRKPKAVAVPVQMLETDAVPTLAAEEMSIVIETIREVVVTETETVAAVEEQVAVMAPAAEQAAPEAAVAAVVAEQEQEISLFEFLPLAEVRKPQIKVEVAQEKPKPKAIRKRTQPVAPPMPAHGVVVPFALPPGKTTWRNRRQPEGQAALFGFEPPPPRTKSSQQLTKAA